MPTNVTLSQVPTVEKIQQAELQKSDQMQQNSSLREGEESRLRTETVRTSPESERTKPTDNEREEKKNAEKKQKERPNPKWMKKRNSTVESNQKPWNE